MTICQPCKICQAYFLIIFRCGPFSSIPKISFSYEIVNWTIDTLDSKLISMAYKMVMSPTVILPCLLVMIMTIYYLYGASKGKDFALTELKSQLLNEREARWF